MVLYMHYVEHVTVAQIYKELRRMGVNISEATLDSWIAIGIDEFKPLMEPTRREIVASGEAYMDETHMLVKCDMEEDARWVTEKMDSIFVKEDSYKGLSDEERKRRRGIEIAPILHEIKQRLDFLTGEKSALDAWKHPGLYEAVDYALREWSAIQNYLLTGSGDFTNNVCEREMRIVATLRLCGIEHNLSYVPVPIMLAS